MTEPNPFRRPPPANVAPLRARAVAAFVDFALLGLVGALLGLVFHSQFSALGPLGRLVGLPIALGYLGIMNSRIGNGATLGKRWLQLRVATMDGTPIELPRSLARAAIYVAPSLCVGWTVLDAHSATRFLSTFFLGVMPAQLLLLLFNRPSRQLVHDLPVGTCVIRVGDEPPAESTAARFVVLAGALPLLLATGMTALLRSSFPQIDTLLVVRDSVLARTPAIEATVSDSWSTFGGARTTALTITAWVPDGRVQDSVAAAVARTALRVMPEARTRDQLAVVLTGGFDIMIFHYTNSQTFAHTPSEWLEPSSDKAGT
jgi:uncharacterized RDD family membrane protein YckC